MVVVWWWCVKSYLTISQAKYPMFTAIFHSGNNRTQGLSQFFIDKLDMENVSNKLLSLLRKCFNLFNMN